MLTFVKSALKNKIFWYLASRYGTFAIQFLTSIWLAVKLGPYYFGLWSFILLLVNVGTQCNWGIANAVNILLVQHKEDRSRCAAYEFNSLIMTGVICIIPFLVALYDTFWPISLFAKYQLGHLSYAVAFIVACFYLNLLFINILRVKNRILEIAINQSLFPVLTFAAIFFATDRQLLYLLVGAYAVAMLASVFLFIRTRCISVAGRISVLAMREIMGKGFYLFLYNACFFLIMLCTKTLVSIYYPVETFGHFAFAFNVSNATVLLIDSLMFLLFPKMIDLLQGGERFAIQARLKEMRTCYIFAMNLLFGCMLCAFGLFIRFLPKYAPSYPIFVALSLTMLVYTWCFGYNVYLLAQNRERMMAAFALMAFLLNAMGVWLMIHVFGVTAAGCLAGTVFAYVVYVALVNSCGRRRLLAGGWRLGFGGFPFLRLVPMIVLAVLARLEWYGWLFLPVLLTLICDWQGMRSVCGFAKRLLQKPQVMDI